MHRLSPGTAGLSLPAVHLSRPPQIDVFGSINDKDTVVQGIHYGQVGR